MKTFLLSSILIFCALVFFTCSKVTTVPSLKTRLVITLADDEGKSVDSTVVKLYKKGIDTPMVKIADSTGLIYYSDLEVAIYYWTAQKGCKNILASQSSLNGPLPEGLASYQYCVLSSRAVLKITNTAPFDYKLTDSTISITFKADTILYAYPKIGLRTLHFVPSDTLIKARDTVMQIKCGDTAFIKLPF
jgi:hypothetical protein